MLFCAAESEGLCREVVCCTGNVQLERSNLRVLLTGTAGPMLPASAVRVQYRDNSLVKQRANHN